MRVELKIDSDCREPYAELHVARLTPGLQTAVSILERENEESFIGAVKEGKTYMLEPEMIELARMEGRELSVYDRQKNRYVVNRPLYELQELLGKSFVRISKSAIIQIRRIHHVEAAFNGTMGVVMKNGVEEVITRSFRQQFKERLGV